MSTFKFGLGGSGGGTIILSTGCATQDPDNYTVFDVTTYRLRGRGYFGSPYGEQTPPELQAPGYFSPLMMGTDEAKAYVLAQVDFSEYDTGHWIGIRWVSNAYAVGGTRGITLTYPHTMLRTSWYQINPNEPNFLEYVYEDKDSISSYGGSGVVPPSNPGDIFTPPCGE